MWNPRRDKGRQKDYHYSSFSFVSASPANSSSETAIVWSGIFALDLAVADSAAPAAAGAAAADGAAACDAALATIAHGAGVEDSTGGLRLQQLLPPQSEPQAAEPARQTPS